MKDLIEALQIFYKYKNEEFPTHCEHDILYIMGITFDEICEVDRNKLNRFGFIWSDSNECWISYRYGSA